MTATKTLATLNVSSVQPSVILLPNVVENLNLVFATNTAKTSVVSEYVKTMGLIQGLFADDCVFHPTLENYLMIVAFCIIFCLSVVGNLIVVVVILQQRSMRSITNLYLLNLALSDLLLSVVCMPPTLISSLVYCWVFGDLLCKLLAYLQPVVVTASAYTLAAIALERYYAICKPLHSRVWHTRSHALIVIGFVWLISIIANVFMLFMYELRTYNRNGLNCSPKYNAIVHFAYQIYMTLVLLLIPLVLMTVLYGSVIRSLKSGIKMDIAAIEISSSENNELIKPRNQSVSTDRKFYHNFKENNTDTNDCSPNTKTTYYNCSQYSSFPVQERNTCAKDNIQNNTENMESMLRSDKKKHKIIWSPRLSFSQFHNQPASFRQRRKISMDEGSNNCNKFLFKNRKNFGFSIKKTKYEQTNDFSDTHLGKLNARQLTMARSVRSTHSGRTALVKQRLIRMLIVIVIIFFCCWTPSYIWWLLLNAQDYFGFFNVWNSELNTFITVLTYLSSCTNPITYCFLNSKFRNALFLSFGCRSCARRTLRTHMQDVYLPNNNNHKIHSNNTNTLMNLNNKNKKINESNYSLANNLCNNDVDNKKSYTNNCRIEELDFIKQQKGYKKLDPYHH